MMIFSNSKSSIRTIVAVVLLIAICNLHSAAQKKASPLAANANLTLQDQWQNLLRKEQSGMLVLGSWALVNIGSGLILQGRYQDERRHFHTMNVGWNAVNLGLAGLGYFRAKNMQNKPVDEYTYAKHYIGTRQTLLLNSGLDLAYMVAGWGLIERSRRPEKQSNQLLGFGQSLILQGAFLFIFDLAFFHGLKNKHLQFSPVFLETGSAAVGISWYW
jgi:hypothetical protein